MRLNKILTCMLSVAMSLILTITVAAAGENHYVEDYHSVVTSQGVSSGSLSYQWGESESEQQRDNWFPNQVNADWNFTNDGKTFSVQAYHYSPNPLDRCDSIYAGILCYNSDGVVIGNKSDEWVSVRVGFGPHLKVSSFEKIAYVDLTIIATDGGEMGSNTIRIYP